MKFILFAKSILLAFVAVLTACNNHESLENTADDLIHDENSENKNSGDDVIQAIWPAIISGYEQDFEKDDIPKWLLEYIDSLKPDNVRNVAAFQGKWKGEVVYYVHDDYFSCVLCDTYKADGEKIDWSKIDYKEFFKSVTDWECIYLSKFRIQDL